MDLSEQFIFVVPRSQDQPPHLGLELVLEGRDVVVLEVAVGVVALQG